VLVTLVYSFVVTLIILKVLDWTMVFGWSRRKKWPAWTSVNTVKWL